MEYLALEGMDYVGKCDTPKVQNIVIDKNTHRVKSISQWSDSRKIDPKSYPEDLVIYIEEKQKFLDLSKSYRYKDDGSFEEIPQQKEEENKFVSLRDLQLQIKQLQQSNAELMNLISMQAITPK